MSRKEKSVQGRSRDLNRDDIRAFLKGCGPEELHGAPRDQFLRVMQRCPSFGEDLAWLGAYDLEPEVSAAAFVAMLLLLKDDEMPAGLRDRFRAQAVPVLQKALESAGISDDRKFAFGPIYLMCTGKTPGPEYASFFKDWEGTARRANDEATRSMSGDPQDVSELLAGVGALADDTMPADARYRGVTSSAVEFAETKPAATAAILSANVVIEWYVGDQGADFDGPLGLIESTRCPEAVWFLEEMQRWPGLGPLAKKAQRTAARMRMTGLAPRNEFRREFHYGILSAPDGTGSRQLTLFFCAQEDELDALMLILNDQVGIKHAMCAFGEGAEVEAMLDAAPDEILLAPCSLELARELIADAWAIHVDQDTPPPGDLFVFRPYLGEAPIVPLRRVPDLTAYHLERLTLSPDLFKNSRALANSLPFGSLFFTSDQAYKLVSAVAPTPWRQMSKKETQTFVRDVAIEERDLLLSRMAAMLEVEALAGRNGRKANRAAAATWLGLSKEVLPFHEVPHIQALAANSIQAIQANLGLGFHSQAEADQAALEMGAPLEDLFGALDD